MGSAEQNTRQTIDLMEQDQLDELEALSAIFVDEYEQISLEQAQPIIESMGWMEDDIKHVVSLKLAPQPDDSGDIHGKCKANYIFYSVSDEFVY